MLGACAGESPGPYSQIKNPPLAQGTLHTITVASAADGLADQAAAAGYSPMTFAANYPPSVRVEATLWDVPESAAGDAALFKAPGGGPDLRIVAMPLAARGLTARDGSEQAFYRNVLGTDVPRWPAGIERAANVRVQAWTYLVPNVVEANKRLRESGVPVIFDPVKITTAYLGDHKTLAIRAPDGTIVQLVETQSR
jgi:hypothetical protein